MPDNNLLQKWFQENSSLTIVDFLAQKESKEYTAASFAINGFSVIYRESKTTPTKIGQFVTVWKRSDEGITQPFDFTDNFDFIIIAATSEINFGAFIFPKKILAEQGIINNAGKEGKRGIRVYPPWDVTANKQAIKTQQWQSKYFIDFTKEESVAAISKIFTKV